jgi:hypothetical protein
MVIAAPTLRDSDLLVHGLTDDTEPNANYVVLQWFMCPLLLLMIVLERLEGANHSRSSSSGYY